MASRLKEPPASLAGPFFSELGQTVVGPVLASFVDWLVENLRRERPDCLLFFGRDGQIIRQAFNLRCPEDLADLPVHYLPASRRALVMASLEKPAPALVEFLAAHANGSPMGLILGGMEVPNERIDLALRSAGTDPAIVYDSSLRQILEEAIQILWPEILAQAAKERSAYLGYLEANHITDYSHFAVVDVGWHGSLQRSLTEILRTRYPEVRTDGYYLGLFPGSRQNAAKGTRLEGFLVNEESDLFSDLQSFVEIVEFLFSSTERGLLRFEISGDSPPSPVFSGQIISEYQRLAIEHLQESALECVREAQFEEGGNPLSILMRLGMKPTAREACFLGPLQATRGFGDIGTLKSMAMPGTPLANLLLWKGFVRRFKDCLWRAGFWARLTAPEKFLLGLLSPVGSRSLR